MTPGNLEPKNHEIIQIIKTRENHMFFQHGKDAHRNSAKGALNDSSRSLIWNFLEQLVFLKIDEKVSKVLNLVQFWVQAVCLTTRLRRVIGWLQTK